MKYKIDCHIHTKETSHCSKVEAKVMIDLYKKNGYDGIVITDHYYWGFFESRYYNLAEKDKIEKFLEGYRVSKIYGEKLNLKVFLGMEIKFVDSDSDYLVYGLDEEFLYRNYRMYNLGLEKFKSLISSSDMLIYQAHPFRGNSKASSSELLDGIEVYNGNKRHDSKNYKALEYSNLFNLNQISGSDFHELGDVGRGGIILEEIPSSNKEFVKLLKENRINKLITT